MTMFRNLAALMLLLPATMAHGQGAAPVPRYFGEGASLYGEEPAGPARPTPRGLDGRPDLTGYWKPLREPGKPTGNLGKDEPGFRLPYSAAGLKALEFTTTKTRDPEALCILGGIPRHNGSILPFQIIHAPQILAVHYVYNTHRSIPIDGRSRDPDEPARYFGTPIGHWEGDTLVIETRGIKDSADGKIWLDENANPVSDQTVVVERWTRPDADHIHLEMDVNDPKYYTRPFHFARTWVLGAAGEGLAEYACSENNITADLIGPGPGPIGPDGTRGSRYGVLPDNPPDPDFYAKPAPPAKAPPQNRPGLAQAVLRPPAHDDVPDPSERQP